MPWSLFAFQIQDKTDLQSRQLMVAQRLEDPLAQSASSKIVDTVAGPDSTSNYHFTNCLI